MANRVTGDEVKEIINTSLSASAVAPMITAANILVTARCESQGYSDAEMKEIERWLAAHFVTARDRSTALASKTIGEASETYSQSTGAQMYSLGSSPYGQHAMLLDYLGCLTTLGKQKAAMRFYGAAHGEFE